MNELNESSHIRDEIQNPEIGRNGEYILIPGDIVAVNPAVEDGIPSGDKWWLLQVNKAPILFKRNIVQPERKLYGMEQGST